MSATLTIINNFQMTTLGNAFTGKQGAAAADFSTGFDITASGQCCPKVGQLATAGAATLFNSSNDLPATFLYMHLWVDQPCYVQVIGSGSNVVFKVAATQPFVLPGFNTVLAAANTTAITGGAEPSLTTVAKVVLGNYSGSTANYAAAFIL